jgi:hypothetical protein
MKNKEIPATILGLILVMLLAACTSTSEPDPGPQPQGSLVGVWVFEDETDDGAKVYTRAAALSGGRSGYEFGEHGGLKVRTTGWCATPPLTWANLDGLWDEVDPGLLKIRHAWRGAPRQFELEIISVNGRRLTCRERTGGGS